MSVFEILTRRFLNTLSYLQCVSYFSRYQARAKSVCGRPIPNSGESLIFQLHHGNLLGGRHGRRGLVLRQAHGDRLGPRGRLLLRAAGEALGNVFKGSPFGFRYFQEGEDEEENEQDHEDDEDVRAQNVLEGGRGAMPVSASGHKRNFWHRLERASVFLTSSLGKPNPTRKLAVQLEHPATATAAGRGPCEKSSATMNHGMGPGPISKLATKPKTATMAR